MKKSCIAALIILIVLFSCVACNNYVEQNVVPLFFKYGDFVAYVLATSFCSSKKSGFACNFFLYGG